MGGDQGFFDIDIEPVVHAGGDKLQGDKKEQGRRDQRQRHERDHQLGPQPAAQQLLFPLEDKLRQVAQHQKNHQQQQQDVDVDQYEDQNVAADREMDGAELEDPGLQKGHDDKQGEAAQNDQADKPLLADFSLLEAIVHRRFSNSGMAG